MKSFLLAMLVLISTSEVLAGYYTRELECRRTGERAARGAVAGGAVGLGLDLLLNGRVTRLTLGGAAVGAGVGALSSCDDVVRYHQDVDDYLDGRRGTRLRNRGYIHETDRGYTIDNLYCVEYYTVFYDRYGDQRRGRARTSCKSSGSLYWRHYEGNGYVYHAPRARRFDRLRERESDWRERDERSWRREQDSDWREQEWYYDHGREGRTYRSRYAQ